MPVVCAATEADARMQVTGESVVEAGSAAAEYAVSGSQVLTVTIR